MPETIKVGIIGAGWPGSAHARGYQAAGGFKVLAVADLIPQRRRMLMADCSIPREYADANDLIKDKEIDAVSICLPNYLHAPVAIAALRAAKHVLCETPPGLCASDARRMNVAAVKAGRVLLFAFQRRFGGHEQAAKVAVAKGLAGEVYHVRSVWTRTRGIPLGTGWFTCKDKSGGGALIDTGIHMLDIAWYLLGQPRPTSVFGLTQQRFAHLLPHDMRCDVEDAAFALVRFEGGKSLELASSWALNQPQNQNGTVCRVYGTAGAIEVYTSQGAVLCRDFKPTGQCIENPLKPPRTTHHVALMRHFRQCIAARATPMAGGPEAIVLMDMLDAIYKSSESGKSTGL
jgi:predicted dehydrogenase